MWISHCTAAPGTSHWESCSKRWTGRSSGGSWRRPSASSPPSTTGRPDIQRLQPLDSFLHGRGDRRNRAGPADQSIYNRTLSARSFLPGIQKLSARRAFHLADIVSEDFETTEYYNAYFAHYVVTDEVQYNVPLDGERTLCLSLGSESRFGAEQIALFELLRPWVIALMKNASTSRMRSGRRNRSQRRRWKSSPGEVDIAADRAGVGCHPADAGWILEQGNSGSADAVDRHHQGASPAHLREAEREVPLRDIRAVDQPARALADARCAACGGTRAHKVMRNSYCPTLKKPASDCTHGRIPSRTIRPCPMYVFPLVR